MVKRKASDTVQLPLRMKENLRVRLEKAAKAEQISMNAEVIRRLEKSFAEDDSLVTLLGGEENIAFATLLFGMIRVVERQIGGDWMNDPATFKAVRKFAIGQAFDSAMVLLGGVRAIRESGIKVTPEALREAGFNVVEDDKTEGAKDDDDKAS